MLHGAAKKKKKKKEDLKEVRKQSIQTARGSDSSRKNGAEVELGSEHQKGGSSAGEQGKCLLQ